MATDNPISRLVTLSTDSGNIAIPFASIVSIITILFDPTHSKLTYTSGADEHVMTVKGTVTEVVDRINTQVTPA